MFHRVVYTQAYAFTAADIISSSLLSSEKHAQLMAYMYNDFTTRHTEILAQADLKPHLHSNIKTWADHRVAAGEVTWFPGCLLACMSDLPWPCFLLPLGCVSP